jgi:hypothetical protein
MAVLAMEVSRKVPQVRGLKGEGQARSFLKRINTSERSTQTWTLQMAAHAD